MRVLTPHLVGTGRTALHVDTQEESSREHFISTALQNIIVKSLALILNIEVFKKKKNPKKNNNNCQTEGKVSLVSNANQHV